MLRGELIDEKGRPLSDRQREVVARMAEGHGVKQIAQELGKSQKVVEYHYKKARERIGLWNLALVTQWALKHGVARWIVGLTLVTVSAFGQLSFPIVLLPKHPLITNAVITVAWDIPNDPSVTGFMLFYGASPGCEYDLAAVVGMTNAATITLPLGEQFVTCRSVSDSGLQSADSNEIHWPEWSVVTVTGTNLQCSAWIDGPWTVTNSPWGPYGNLASQMFFRGNGRVTLAREFQ